jgi:hypothetical protein
MGEKSEQIFDNQEEIGEADIKKDKNWFIKTVADYQGKYKYET